MAKILNAMKLASRPIVVPTNKKNVKIAIIYSKLDLIKQN